MRYEKCPKCGSEVKSSTTYSMPSYNNEWCEKCGWSVSYSGHEQIQVLSLEEGMMRRPQLYISAYKEMKLMLQTILDESLRCEDAKDFVKWVQKNLNGNPLLIEY